MKVTHKQDKDSLKPNTSFIRWNTDAVEAHFQ